MLMIGPNDRTKAGPTASLLACTSVLGLLLVGCQQPLVSDNGGSASNGGGSYEDAPVESPPDSDSGADSGEGTGDDTGAPIEPDPSDWWFGRETVHAIELTIDDVS